MTPPPQQKLLESIDLSATNGPFVTIFSLLSQG